MSAALAYSGMETKWFDGQSRGAPADRPHPSPVVWTTVLDWRPAAARRLDYLKGLPVGWDGHGGLPVTRPAAGFALAVMSAILRPGRTPLPSIMPLSYGGVQLEWHRKAWDIEIEIVRPYEVYAWARNLATGHECELNLAAEFGVLAELIDHISD